VEVTPVQRLQIAVSSQSGCQVVDVCGDVDMSTCAQLAAALERGRRPGVPLVADLSDVEFFDASGLWALLAANDASPEWGAPLRVVPSRAVELVIEVAGARDLLAVFPDRRRALEGGPAVNRPSAMS
jgi:anti-sigma B factor antagonist